MNSKITHCCMFLLLQIFMQHQVFSQELVEIPDVMSYQLVTDGTGNGPTLSSGDQFGRSVAEIGDLNNDGINDIVVGVPNDDAGFTDAGAVYICFMNTNGTVKSSPSIAKINSGTSNFTTLAVGDGFGISVAGIGDLNNDGNEDIAVGAYSHDGSFNNVGIVYIVFLNSTGGVVSYQSITSGTANFGTTLSADDNLGISVASLGDINGDGLTDIVAGAKGFGSKGAAFVMKLKGDGTLLACTKIGDVSGGFGGTLHSSDFFGISVTGAGDLDGDGRGDAIIGASGDDDGYLSAGALWIVYLDSSGTVLDQKKISNPLVSSHYYPSSASVSFGESISVTDINEDGITDIMAGVKTFNSNKGAFYFMVLDSIQEIKAIRTIGFNYSWGYSGPATAPQFGAGICETTIGGFSSHRQYITGANMHANGASTSEGSIYVLTMDSLTSDFPTGTVVNYSSINDFSGDFTATLDNSDFFGTDAACIGDLNDDGIDDLIVGANGDDDGASNSGAVYVLFMTADDRVGSYQKISNSAGDLSTYFTLSASDQFGHGVGPAGDFDNDGIEDVIVGAIQDGPTDNGAIYLLYLGTDGKVDGANKITIAGAPSTDFLGIDVDTIGDLDNDGVVDFVAGAYQNDDGGTNRGAVYVIFMNSNGTVKASQRISDTQGGFTDTLSNNDLFGISVDGIGDFDGDGTEDIAVGSNRNGTGAVYIIYLNTNGTVKDYVKINNTVHTFPKTLKAGQIFGQSVQMVPDIDGNGISDLLICNVGYKTYKVQRGAVWIAFLDSLANVINVGMISDSSNKLYTNMHDTYTFGYCTRYYGTDSVGNLKIICGDRDDATGADRGGIMVLTVTTLMSPLIKLANQYEVPHRELDAGYYSVVHSPYFNFEFDEEYLDTDGALNYKVYDKYDNIVLSSSTLPLTSHVGDNRKHLLISGLAHGYYVLEVQNEKNEIFRLRFKK